MQGTEVTVEGTDAETAPDRALDAAADEKRTKMSWLMVGLGAAMALGSLLPWATSDFGGSLNGLSAGLGYGTLAGGILLGLYGYQGLRKDDPVVRHHGWAIAAVSVAICASVGAWSVVDDLGSLGGVVNVGSGLWIAVIASLTAIWPLVQLRKDGKLREREAHRGEVTAIASAIAAGSESPAASYDAGWYEDPLTRHELRYHDGSVWTEHVADGEQRAVDPLP